MPKARISQQFMQKARHKPPGFYWDGGTGAIKGFGVRTDKAGRAFSYVFQARGSTRQVIGRVDRMDLTDAREAAHALAAKRPQKASPSCTLEEGLAAHLESMRARGCSAQSTVLIEYEVKRYAADHLGKRLSRFTHEDVASIHQSVSVGPAKRRPVAANRMVRHLSAIFGTADAPFPLKRKWWRTHKNKVNESGTAPVHDLPAFGAALRDIGNPVVADWWRLALLTALRKEDGLTIRRDEVDARRKGWLLRPAPKGGETRAFEFPLPTQARAIIDRLPAFEGNPYLFPSARTRIGRLMNPGKPMGVHAHQARATWISRAAEIGCPMPVIKRLVNHSTKKRDITEKYITINDKVLAIWAQKVADSLWAEIEGSANENHAGEEGLQEQENVQ
jgi:integrase